MTEGSAQGGQGIVSVSGSSDVGGQDVGWVLSDEAESTDATGGES